ncbi:MAG: hypothetical protein ACI828_002487 [Flavobacteriales bacterium]|jgi:hypothetical protein
MKHKKAGESLLFRVYIRKGVTKAQLPPFLPKNAVIFIDEKLYQE